MTERAGLQHFLVCLVGIVLGRLRIAQHLAQRADRQIGLLRQEQQALAARQFYQPMAGAELVGVDFHGTSQDVD